MKMKMESYLQKIEQNPYEDLYWNLPETKKGTANAVGGNVQSFQTVVRTAEFLGGQYPLNTVNVVLPEPLRTQLPNLPNFQFLPATKAGSFNGEGLAEALASVDTNLLIGDLSKNAITGKALAEILAGVTKPTLVTRDAADLLAEQAMEKILLNENVSFLVTGKQLQKILRAVYYPKMMTLSMSLMQVAELLHKFSLSYPVGVATLYNEQILVAKDGRVEMTELANSGYSPLTLWNGQVAAKIVALNLYNPNSFVAASMAAIWQK